jgi:ABC-type cobalamin/Fe3+-siderophores transport system ATPase subunit
VAAGSPHDVITADLVHDVFGLPAHVSLDPIAGTPLVLPLGPPGRVFETSTPTRKETE